MEKTGAFSKNRRSDQKPAGKKSFDLDLRETDLKITTVFETYIV